MTDETGTYYAIPPERLAEGIEGWRVVAPGGPDALDSIHFRAMGTGVHAIADAKFFFMSSSRSKLDGYPQGRLEGCSV